MKYTIPKFEDEMGSIKRYIDVLKEDKTDFEHDCHNSQDDGCQYCLENWEIKEKKYGNE